MRLNPFWSLNHPTANISRCCFFLHRLQPRIRWSNYVTLERRTQRIHIFFGVFFSFVFVVMKFELFLNLFIIYARTREILVAFCVCGFNSSRLMLALYLSSSCADCKSSKRNHQQLTNRYAFFSIVFVVVVVVVCVHSFLLKCRRLIINYSRAHFTTVAALPLLLLCSCSHAMFISFVPFGPCKESKWEEREQSTRRRRTLSVCDAKSHK